MSLYQFRLPDVGEGITEAELAGWHAAVGDLIVADAPLVDVATDKAIVDITSPVSGRVVALHGSLGEKIAVGAVLVEIETTGVAAASADEPATGPAPRPARTEAPTVDAAEPLAAPATRQKAKDLGVALSGVTGTGPDGRILPSDLDAHIEQPHNATTPPADGASPDVVDVPIIGIRRKIAERLQESKRRIPHFSYVEEIDMTEVEHLRRTLNAEATGDRPQLTPLPFFIRALVRALPEFPAVNSHYDDEHGVLRQHRSVHVGIATQTPAGLLVPVVRHADRLGLWDTAREIRRLTDAARRGASSRDDLAGSTITLTSLGPLGGICATPILNPPEVAILGPNRIDERPIVRGGQIVIRSMMNLSSSFDHRIVDGYDAARFVARLKQLLECPGLLFIDRR